jgi:hypothetical protein
MKEKMMKRLRPDEIDAWKERIFAAAIAIGLAFTLAYCGGPV